MGRGEDRFIRRGSDKCGGFNGHLSETDSSFNDLIQSPNLPLISVNQYLQKLPITGDEVASSTHDGRLAMISLQTEDFNVGAEYTALRHQAGDAGAIVLFTGLVGTLWRRLRFDGLIELSAYF